jgi:hypothetical protein
LTETVFIPELELPELEPPEPPLPPEPPPPPQATRATDAERAARMMSSRFMGDLRGRVVVLFTHCRRLRAAILPDPGD